MTDSYIAWEPANMFGNRATIPALRMSVLCMTCVHERRYVRLCGLMIRPTQ